VIIKNFFNEKLAQASYFIGCSATDQAIVIDPARDIRPYLAAAASHSMQIVAVTETHIHADYLSGTRELASATGATMYLSDEGDDSWKYEFGHEPSVVLLRHGDLITIGNLTLKVLHTPGHTPEHLSFLLTDHPASSSPNSLFTGDFVFVGDVGRPDLLERAAKISGTMEKGAAALFGSLQALQELPDYLLMWPGHGAGSACGKALGGSPATSLGYERRTNWALQVSTEAIFIDEILAGQPEPPAYFKEMKRLNKAGPPVLGKLPHVRRSQDSVGQIIDARPLDELRNGFLSGAIAIPFGKYFTTWAGWMVNYVEPITIVADSQAGADQVALDLASIGLDQVVGWIDVKELDPNRFTPIHTDTGATFNRDALILDIRGAGERSMSHIAGSVHIPLGYLRERIDELPRDREIVVHCAYGSRSPIAYSILKSAGFSDVRELLGGLSAVEATRPELVLTG